MAKILNKQGNFKHDHIFFYSTFHKVKFNNLKNKNVYIYFFNMISILKSAQHRNLKC